MSKARNLADLLEAGGDVKLASLDNAPAPSKSTIDALGIAATSVTGTQASDIIANNAKVTNYNQTKADIEALGIAASSITGTLPAIDGSALTNLPSANSADISLLYLYMAEQKTTSSGVTMVDGITDAYNASTANDNIDTSLSQGYLPSVNTLTQAAASITPNNMTSNTAPSPYVVSNSSGASSAWETFDGAITYEGTPLGGWSKIDLGAAATVGSYAIVAGVNTSGYAWKTWTFQGSNNDSSWTTLDTRTNFTAWNTTGTPTNFTCSAGSYRYYRWAPTAHGGVGAYSQQLIAFGASGDMLVISNSQTASAVPTTARIGVQLTAGSYTINTDVTASVSRDNGTTWSLATLVLVDTLSDGTSYYEDNAVSLTSQPSGTSVRYKFTVLLSSTTTISGSLLQWG